MLVRVAVGPPQSLKPGGLGENRAQPDRTHGRGLAATASWVSAPGASNMFACCCNMADHACVYGESKGALFQTS